MKIKTVTADAMRASLVSPEPFLTLLDADGNSTGTDHHQTDSEGYYIFDELLPGTYGVAEAQPHGIPRQALTAPERPAERPRNPGDKIVDATLNPGVVVGKNYDFGELRPASVSGHVYLELNGNCHWESGEPFLPGVTIYAARRIGHGEFKIP